MFNFFKKYWLTIIIIALVAALIGTGQKKISFSDLNFQSGENVAQKAVDYINENMLQGQTATLENVKALSGVYQFKLKIGDQEFDSYVTKDGAIVFPQGIVISDKKKEAPSTESGQSKQSCADLQKSNQPVLEAFVVSKCPFGVQMQRILAEVVKNIPEAGQYIKVVYMGNITNGKLQAMHDKEPGGEEATENMRQICLREQQADKYWNYILCHIKKGEVDSCLTEVRADKDKLNVCLKNSEQGLAYAKKDIERQDKFNVTGSPTVVLNDSNVSEFDFGGRTAEALKTVICCGFKNQPAFCSQKLNSDQAAPGFSETYTRSGDSAASSCN